MASAPGTPAIPPPPDYGPFLAQSSDNMLMGLRTQIGANMISQQQMMANQQLAIMTNMVTQLEGLDVKMQIAKLNFVEQMDKHQLKFEESRMRHEEKLAEIDLKREMDGADGDEAAPPAAMANAGWNRDYSSYTNNTSNYTPPEPSEIYPPEGEEQPT